MRLSKSDESIGRQADQNNGELGQKALTETLRSGAQGQA